MESPNCWLGDPRSLRVHPGPQLNGGRFSTAEASSYHVALCGARSGVVSRPGTSTPVGHLAVLNGITTRVTGVITYRSCSKHLGNRLLSPNYQKNMGVYLLHITRQILWVKSGNIMGHLGSRYNLGSRYIFWSVSKVMHPHKYHFN